MWPSDPVEQEKLLRELIAGKTEAAKLDFKSSIALDPRERAVDLVKGISEIANTDDSRFAEFGFLIIGAKRGELVGGEALFEAATVDKTSSSLHQLAREYVQAMPEFDLVHFRDSMKGPWGVIVIRPSTAQPHIFIKEFQGDKLKVRRGEWYLPAQSIASFGSLLPAWDHHRPSTSSDASHRQPQGTQSRA